MPAQNTDKHYKISDIASVLKVSQNVIRKWESQYDIQTSRNKLNHRIYTQEDLEKLKKLQKKLNSKANILKNYQEEQLKNDKTFRISDVSSILGVSQNVIRKWESKYGFQIPRDERDHRVYTQDEVNRLKNLQKRINSKAVIEKKYHKKQVESFVKSINKRALLGVALTLLFLASLTAIPIFPLIESAKNVLNSKIEGPKKEVVQKEIKNVLGQRDQISNYVFEVNIPTNLRSTLTVEGPATFEDTITTGGVSLTGTGNLGGLTSIDTQTGTTLETSLELTGDVTGPLNNTTLGTDITHNGKFKSSGTFNITGELQADGDTGEDGQVLTSTGSTVEWLDIDADDAETLDGLDSLQFLRSDASDSFTSGKLTFSDGTFLDLSSILQNDTTPQGLKLPQNTTLTAPSSGEGYLAYDTDENKIYIYNGSAWTDVSGSTYLAGNDLDLSGTTFNIESQLDFVSTIAQDSSNLTLQTTTSGDIILDSAGSVGIGTTNPSSALDVVGTAGFSSTISATNIGADTDNSVVVLNSSGLLKTDEIDSRVWGSTLLDDTDIDSTVQSYDANTTLLGQTIETGEITDDTILEADLDLTNSPTDDYLLTYDTGSSGFTWVAPSTVGALDGSGTANFVPIWSDSDTLGASSIYETGGQIGIGTTDPQDKLQVADGWFSVHATSGSANIFAGDRGASEGKRLRLAYNFTTDNSVINSYDGASSTYQKLNIDGSTLILNTASGGNVGVGDITPDSPLEILSTTDPQLRLSYDDGVDDATFGVSDSGTLSIIHNGAYTVMDYPADGAKNLTLKSDENDQWAAVGRINFQGLDSTSNDTTYSAIAAAIEDSTDGSEDGYFHLINRRDGAEKGVVQIFGGGDETSNIRLFSEKTSGTPSVLYLYGHDSGGNNAIYGYLSSSITDSTDTSEDGKLGLGTISAGSTGIRAYLDADSLDFQQATSITTTTGDLTLNPADNVGIGTASPSRKLDVGGMTLGSTPDPDANILSTGGMIISDNKRLSFDDNYYVHANMQYNSTGTSEAKFELQGYYGLNFITRSNSRMVIKGDTGDVGIGIAAPSVLLDVDQGAEDDRIQYWRSSDIAHGMTSEVPTDVFGSVEKWSDTAGGLKLHGLTEGSVALGLFGYSTSHSSTKNGTGRSVMEFWAAPKSGTTVGDWGTSDWYQNAFGFRAWNDSLNAFRTGVIITAGGYIYMDGNSYTAQWDEYDDIDLLSGYRALVSRDEQFIADNTLEAAYAEEILTRDNIIDMKDGDKYVNLLNLTYLNIDATRMTGLALRPYQRAIEAIPNNPEDTANKHRDNTQGYNLYVQGAIHSAANQQSSDERLKTNLETITGIKDRLTELNPVYFDWKSQDFPEKGLPDGRQVGLIAQQVEPYFPELVSQDNQGYKTLAYPQLSVLLLSGFQEQQKDINTLQTSQITTTNRVEQIEKVLGLSETSESTESTESSSTLSGLTDLISEVTSIFNEFKEFTEALGLSKVTDPDGNDMLAVSSDMNVVGSTTLSDVNITGDLMAGLIKIDSIENSIDVEGPDCTLTSNTELCDIQTLYLQKNLAGNVDVFNGQIILTPNGTIETTALVASIYTVRENEDNNTIGSDTIIQNAKEIFIKTNQVDENSKIFVTPTTNTSSEPIYVKDKQPQNGFTVAINKPVENDIEFDWWIVKTK